MPELISITDDRFDLDTAPALAAVVKAVADPNRLFILSLLGDQPEMRVLDLTALMNITQPTTSHHLKILLDAGLLTRTQRGVWAWYSLNKKALRAVSDAIRPGRGR